VLVLERIAGAEVPVGLGLDDPRAESSQGENDNG